MGDNSTSTCLVTSKSRVTPTHSPAIPRIELQAAELLSKFMKLIYEHLSLSERIDVAYCWTDSMIVLAYVQNISKRFETYIERRMEIIRNLNVGLSSSKKNCFICFNGSPLKIMKNAFYFTLKAFFVLKIFKFLS